MRKGYYFQHFFTRLCTPETMSPNTIATPETMPPSTVVTPGKKIEAFREEPFAPNLKIELCFMQGMTSRSMPPVHPTMDIAIVNCKMGETCTPSNSEIFGNEFGYVFLLLYTLLCNSLIHF